MATPFAVWIEQKKQESVCAESGQRWVDMERVHYEQFCRDPSRPHIFSSGRVDHRKRTQPIILTCGLCGYELLWRPDYNGGKPGYKIGLGMWNVGQGTSSR